MAAFPKVSLDGATERQHHIARNREPELILAYERNRNKISDHSEHEKHECR